MGAAIKKNNVPGFIISRIGREKVFDFASWAWGPDYSILETWRIRSAWNNLHGDVLFLDGSKEIEIDLIKMISLWEKLGEPQGASTDGLGTWSSQVPREIPTAPPQYPFPIDQAALIFLGVIFLAAVAYLFWSL